MRSEEEQVRDKPKDPPSTGRVVLEQREANQRLLLAGLRAQTQAEAALAAQAQAEEAATALRKETEQLAAAAEFRERLIGIVGHDLRNPLNSMIMGGNLLLSGGSLQPEDAKIALRIVNSGQRMARMIAQLTEFTRARLGGGFELRLEPSDLGEICERVSEELRLGTSTNIVVTTSGDVRGTWDVDRLSAVVSNLAGNATDHATPGSPVSIRVYADGDTVVTEIENLGPCIPAEALPTIFAAFRRGGTANESRKGGHLGLGLFISDQIVRSHGGALSARSSKGRTTFTMTLPRAAGTSLKALR